MDRSQRMEILRTLRSLPKSVPRPSLGSNSEHGLKQSPLSYTAFQDRVRTFCSYTNWVAKPSELSPLVCAASGWINSSYNELKCESCAASLPCMLPPAWCRDGSYETAVESIVKDLRTAHKTACIWQDTTCPESFLALSAKTERKDATMRIQSLLELGDEIPVVDQSVLGSKGIQVSDCQDITDKLNMQRDVTSSVQDLSAVVTGLAGWSVAGSDSSKPILLSCQRCFRTCAPFNFQTFATRQPEEAVATSSSLSVQQPEVTATTATPHTERAGISSPTARQPEAAAIATAIAGSDCSERAPSSHSSADGSSTDSHGGRLEADRDDVILNVSNDVLARNEDVTSLLANDSMNTDMPLPNEKPDKYSLSQREESDGCILSPDEESDGGILSPDEESDCGILSPDEESDVGILSPDRESDVIMLSPDEESDVDGPSESEQLDAEEVSSSGERPDVVVSSDDEQSDSDMSLPDDEEPAVAVPSPNEQSGVDVSSSPSSERPEVVVSSGDEQSDEDVSVSSRSSTEDMSACSDVEGQEQTHHQHHVASPAGAGAGAVGEWQLTDSVGGALSAGQEGEEAAVRTAMPPANCDDRSLTEDLSPSDSELRAAAPALPDVAAECATLQDDAQQLHGSSPASEPQAKRPRLDGDEGTSPAPAPPLFHPVNEHRWWCPWAQRLPGAGATREWAWKLNAMSLLSSVSASSSSAGIAADDDASHTPAAAVSSGTDTSPSKTIADIRSLLKGLKSVGSSRVAASS